MAQQCAYNINTGAGNRRHPCLLLYEIQVDEQYSATVGNGQLWLVAGTGSITLQELGCLAVTAQQCFPSFLATNSCVLGCFCFIKLHGLLGVRLNALSLYGWFV